jgi:hypothetical protein
MNIGELFLPGQLIGKTFFVTKPIDFFRVDDINNFGDNARPVSNKLKTGYSFVMDSFLLPREAGTGNYGIKYAKRSNPYFTFFGTDGKYYAVIFKSDNRFSLKKLKEQGAQSDADLQAAAAAAAETTGDKLTKLLKTVVYIGVGIFAAGYLIPKLKK